MTLQPVLWRVAGTATATACALVLTYLLFLAVQIRRQGERNEVRPAEAIVVLGAAKYAATPSPVLRARLDHALELYRRGYAPYIITTGGAGGDVFFTEGEVGRGYLTKRGVPSEAIIVEPEGESTSHSVAAVAEIMSRMRMRSCIVVSDNYHIYRVKQMLRHYHIKAYGSPRPSLPKSRSQEWRLHLRQAVGYLLWSLGITI